MYYVGYGIELSSSDDEGPNPGGGDKPGANQAVEEENKVGHGRHLKGYDVIELRNVIDLLSDLPSYPIILGMRVRLQPASLCWRVDPKSRRS